MQVTVQPVQLGPSLAMLGPPKPQNYMILSILVLLCCNPPCGLIALLYSHQSNIAYNAGDIEGARQKGKNAFLLNVVGIVICVLVSVILVMNYTLHANK